MSPLSLGQAAKLAGVGKTTISRAIASGRLSAARNGDGGYAIDPSELARVYTIELDPKTGEPIAATRSAERDTTQAGTASLEQSERSELQSLLAVLEERIDGLKSTVDAERRRADAAEADRDRWASQAEKIAALLPAPASATNEKKPGLLDRVFGRKQAS